MYLYPLLSPPLNQSMPPCIYDRNLIEKCLPEVFESLAGLFRAAKGRMSAMNIEERVKKVLSAWKDWSLFPMLFIVGLEAMFYFPQTEVSLLQQFLQSKDTLASAADKEDVDGIKKRAKHAGLCVDERSNIYELGYKLDYIERYSKRLNYALDALEVPETDKAVVVDLPANILSAGIANADDIDGEPMVVSNVAEEEDIDGVPMCDPGLMVGHDLCIAGGGVAEAVEGDEEGEEDVDGVPMD